MQIFPLDLKTLLQILARQKQRGLLQANIPSEKLRYPGTRQVLHASILLDNGIIQACTIALKQGELVAEGQDALQLLMGVGVIEWQWRANVSRLPDSPPQVAPSYQAPASSTVRFSLFAASVLQRTSRSEAALPTLPREYRKILALVDGQRSVHKLAIVLALSEEEVMTALRVLQSQGLVS